MGDMPRIRDIEDYFSRKMVLVCRDRIQIILNHCHDPVSVISKKTNIDYDVTELLSSIPQKENRNSSSSIIIDANKTQELKGSQSSAEAALSQ